MPRPLKPIPRPCPSCGHSIKQKYFKTCGHCRAEQKRQKKLAREIYRAIKAKDISYKPKNSVR